ncbi:MAG: beta-hydroxyacyl-ACP dehydratase [Verrucomicrobiales bacterium]|nr:beta-hydroxyacyl-ACP dehydratase [Verrucomicrobiales bacterium]MCP5527495.1 beta-hydroxyacyl-ACP dehydratase [Verrucomicrobiales bacterium]
MSVDLVQALRALPHGPEFRFLDRLLALDPGRSGRAEYTLRGDEPFLRGHFPGQPLLPGVLLIEAAAQLAGVVAQSDPDVPPLADLRLTAVRVAKILGAPRPGDVVRVQAEIRGRLAGLVQASARVEMAGQLLATTELVLSGRPVARPAG